MSVSNYIVILSVIIVVAGWFVNSWLNRRHEIAKKRIDHRLEMLKSYISFTVSAFKNKSLDGFNDIQVSFLQYGYQDEVHSVEEITQIAMTNPKDEELSILLNKLMALNVLVKNRLRQELGLPKINIKYDKSSC